MDSNYFSSWEAERLGKFTASEIWKLMTKSKTKGELFGQTAQTYIKSKVAELITGERTPDVNSNAIEYGRALEEEAFEYFKFIHPELNPEHFGIKDPKFFPYGDFAGGSPDGFTVDGILEIKCPYNSTNHIQHLLLSCGEDLKDYSPEYFFQVQANMMFTEREIAYFISYDPRVIHHEQRIKVLRVYKDESVHQEISERIKAAAEMMTDFLTKIGTIKVTSKL